MGAFGADRCEHVTKTNLRRRPVPSFVSDEPRPRFSFRETSRNRNSALSAPCARVPSRGQPSRARFAMSDTRHRRPPTGVRPGMPPRSGARCLEAPSEPKVVEELAGSTSKVAPSVSSSLKGSARAPRRCGSTVEEITRDIAGDVREAFRPGCLRSARVSARDGCGCARGDTPKRPRVARPPASASSRDAAGALGGFAAASGGADFSEPPPPSAGERLESIFAALEAGRAYRPRGGEAGRRAARGVERDRGRARSGGDSGADVGGSDATALLRDETADAFSSWGRCEKKRVTERRRRERTYRR